MSTLVDILINPVTLRFSYHNKELIYMFASHPEQQLDAKEIRKLDPFSIYALVSSIEAVKSAKLDLENSNLDRMGVIIGCGIGGIKTLESEHDIINRKLYLQL